MTLDVTVAGTNVTHYAYKLGATASTDCSNASGYSSTVSPAAIATHITSTTTALAYGQLILCVIGRDALGNWQSTSLATTTSWTKIPIFDVLYKVSTIQANGEYHQYATNASGSWVVQEANGSPQFESKTSFASTSAGALYFVASIYQWADSVIYGPYGGTYSWPLTTIFDPGGKGTYAGKRGSLAANSNDKLHIVSSGYINSTLAGQLHHATNKSGSWVNSNITTYADSSVDAISNSSIAIASNNDVLLITVRKKTTTAYVLEYRRYTDANSTWSAATEIMPTNCTKMINAEIGLDSTNKIHVGYSCNTASACIAGYGTYDGSTWANEATIDTINTSVCTVEYPNYSPSIAVDSAGKAHVTYINVPTSRIMYATNASGSWVGSIINTTTTPQRTFIAIDPSDNPYVLYPDMGPKNLFLAHKLSGTWASQTVYGGGALGSDTWGMPEDFIVRKAKGRNNRP